MRLVSLDAALFALAMLTEDSDAAGECVGCWHDGVEDARAAVKDLPVVAPTCQHPKERVEMLARVDTETVQSAPLGHHVPLTWSPICRACGADVPQKAAA